jgi:hypothetical protein
VVRHDKTGYSKIEYVRQGTVRRDRFGNGSLRSGGQGIRLRVAGLPASAQTMEEEDAHTVTDAHTAHANANPVLGEGT